jgi:outer membrane lipoprotein SlyB
LEVDIMEKKVIGYFQEGKQAEEALSELKQKGINEISILGNDERGGQGKDQGRGNQNLSGGTMTGGAIGGIAGLAIGTGALGALGAAALVIPGIGPILAMGPLAAALGGAVTGGVAGALVDYGIPKERSDFYETKIKEGNTVMILKTDESKTDQAASILRNHGAQDVRVH